MQKGVGCRSCAAKIWRSALCYELVPIYARAFFCAKCCMMSATSIFFGYVSVRTSAILKAGKDGGEPILLLSDVLYMTLSLNHSLIAVVSSHSMN